MSGQVFSCQAIVLDQRNYGEADLIVSLFSRQFGRIQTIAKSARKSKRRFVNKLEIFTLLDVFLRPPRRGLALLEEAELVNSFVHIRQNIALYAAASLLREFLLITTHEGDADPELFALTLWALARFDQGADCRVVTAQFLSRFYEHIGYRPELEHCRQCGQTMTTGPSWLFNTARGGIICPLCASDHGGQPIQPGTAKFLVSCRAAPLPRLHRLKIAEAPLVEALNILWRYGNAVLGREIVSWRLFTQLTAH
ncbi:MAG: DNA repair protein RecO [Desulfobulbaceae bacterium]|jgi:DNA repair protein RecO (recombination protein O)|nr:DNA repair protein RecO [Desulfobulbaceae bacterium]